MADQLLGIAKTFDSALDLKYNKFYIGLAKNGQPYNFVALRAQKTRLRLDARLERDEEIETKLEEHGLDIDYDQKRGSYRIRLSKGDVKEHEEILTHLLQRSYEYYGG